jgi:hypothetical protein
VTDPERLFQVEPAMGFGIPMRFGDFQGVNVFCDHHHDRIYVAGFMPSMNPGVPDRVHMFDAEAANLIGDDKVMRERYKITCTECGKNLIVRAERLAPIIEVLLKNGITEVTLGALERRITDT